MKRVEFAEIFPYRIDSSGVAAPILPVRLFLGTLEADLPLLVDTGAERSLLDGAILRAAGLDIFTGAERTFQGFLGSRMVAYEHACRIQICEHRVTATVAFSPQPLLRQVMGRDLLAHFVLGLREKALELYLGPEPSARL